MAQIRQIATKRPDPAEPYRAMMGKTHAIAGSLFVAGGAPPVSNALDLGLSGPELAAGVAIGAVAGVLPDIDHPDSFITHGVIPGSRAFGPIGKGLGYLACIPPRIVGVGARATMNHRGGTHSLLFMLGWTLLAAPIYACVFSAFIFIASILLAPVTQIVGIGAAFDPSSSISWIFANLPSIMPLVMISVFFGYLAHLVTDSMTNVPVPWPWPFSQKRISILPKPLQVTTDSFVENQLIRPLLLVLLVAMIVLNIVMPVGGGILDQAKSEVNDRAGSRESRKVHGQSGKSQYHSGPRVGRGYPAS